MHYQLLCRKMLACADPGRCYIQYRWYCEHHGIVIHIKSSCKAVTRVGRGFLPSVDTPIRSTSSTLSPRVTAMDACLVSTRGYDATTTCARRPLSPAPPGPSSSRRGTHDVRRSMGDDGATPAYRAYVVVVVVVVVATRGGRRRRTLLPHLCVCVWARAGRMVAPYGL